METATAGERRVVIIVDGCQVGWMTSARNGASSTRATPVHSRNAAGTRSGLGRSTPVHFHHVIFSVEWVGIRRGAHVPFFGAGESEAYSAAPAAGTSGTCGIWSWTRTRTRTRTITITITRGGIGSWLWFDTRVGGEASRRRAVRSGQGRGAGDSWGVACRSTTAAPLGFIGSGSSSEGGGCRGGSCTSRGRRRRDRSPSCCFAGGVWGETAGHRVCMGHVGA